MPRVVAPLVAVLALLCCVAPARGEEDAPKIQWAKDVPSAFMQAIKQKKVVLLCLGAPDLIVDGEVQGTLSKLVRDRLYKNSLVVEASRKFVCVLLTKDYEKLMREQFGMKPPIAVPQHVFAHPRHVKGERPLYTRQFWQFQSEEQGAKAFIGHMKTALRRFEVKEAMPKLPKDTPEARAAWIPKVARLVRDGNPEYRAEALDQLRKRDRDGDCVKALVPLIDTFAAANDKQRLLDVLRYAITPDAVDVIHPLLDHDDRGLRGTAAVTLEYIGAKASVDPLLARIKREKDDGVANHLYRAVGRCGAGDDSVRKKLLRKAAPAKGEDFPRFGAVIGLAYFAGDAKAARGLERNLTKLGLPFQTGSKAKEFLRALTVWALSEIRDPKSGAYVQKKLLDKLAKDPPRGADAVMTFYGAVARTCEGHEGLQEEIDKGIEAYRWRDRAGDLVDGARTGRDMQKFKPKAEWGNRSTHE